MRKLALVVCAVGLSSVALAGALLPFQQKAKDYFDDEIKEHRDKVAKPFSCGIDIPPTADFSAFTQELRDAWGDDGARHVGSICGSVYDAVYSFCTTESNKKKIHAIKSIVCTWSPVQHNKCDDKVTLGDMKFDGTTFTYKMSSSPCNAMEMAQKAIEKVLF
jgi:hypothetical protein